MADFIVRATQSSIATGSIAIPGTNLRQELVTEENVQRWIAEDRVFTMNVGSINSPASFIGAVFANAVPEFAYTAPAGAFMIPLQVSITVITCAAGVWNNVIYTSSAGIAAGTSSSTVKAITPSGKVAGGPILYSYTAASATVLTNPLELYRFGTATAQNPVLLGAPQPPLWGYKTHLMPRIRSGQVFMVGTGQAGASTGYIQVTFAEFNNGDN